MRVGVCMCVCVYVRDTKGCRSGSTYGTYSLSPATPYSPFSTHHPLSLVPLFLLLRFFSSSSVSSSHPPPPPATPLHSENGVNMMTMTCSQCVDVPMHSVEQLLPFSCGAAEFRIVFQIFRANFLAFCHALLTLHVALSTPVFTQCS